MSKSTNRFLVIGGSGSGKTTLVKSIVEAYRARGAFRYLVVVSKDAPEHSALAPLCDVHVEIDSQTAALELDLVKAVQDAKSVYFEMTAVDHVHFLEQLGPALLELGAVLAVVDEAQNVLDRNTPPQMLEVATRGRKLGVHWVCITQSLKQRPTYGLNATFINEASCLVTFLKSDPNEQKHVLALFPELGERLGELRTPRDGAPEYAVRDMLTGRGVLVARDGEHDLTAGGAAMS